MIRIVALALLFAVGVPAQTARPVNSADRPNIVYILADDMGYGDVSSFNSAAAWKTPNLDRLGAAGMVFTDAHSGSAVCTPTRYGIITGRYAWRSRLKQGVLWGASKHLIDPSRMTVASMLKKHGYHTACIGKWHLGWDFAKKKDDPKAIDFNAPVKNGPHANGFDYYYCHNGSLDMEPYVYVENNRITAAPDRTTENKDRQGFWRRGPTGADFIHEEVLPNFTQRAAAYVRTRAQSDKPFFLYLALPAPHLPMLPTAEFKGKSRVNTYGDFVLQVDATVGTLMRAVAEAGVADNTLFIVTADNGCTPRANFDELAKFGHRPSGPFRGHKADAYEGGHRVPFIARWPKRIEGGSKCDQTICLTDLMRTCADIVGTTLPDDAGEDSVSILPALTGAAKGPLREATVHHSIQGSFAIRQGNWKLLLCPGSGGWSAPHPRAARKQRLPLRQLFDLHKDPGERNNIAAAHPKVAKRLTELLARYVERGRSTPGDAQTNDGKVEYLPKPYPLEEPKKFEKSEVVYKEVGNTQLRLHLFRPRGDQSDAPAIVFFFGGGWNSGNPNQFFPHCEHLALRGMVAVSAEYRVKSKHGATPFDCVADARSAIRYLRRHAKEIGLDPNRIAAGGGSAGGHLAAATATLPVPASESKAEQATSSRPNALVLFNPVFDNGPGGWGHGRVGDRYREISPIHNLNGTIAPTVVFLGTKDQLIPVATAERYRDLMKKGGNRCDLHLYPERGHGFFNHRAGKNADFRRTVETMDAFLSELGFLTLP